MNKEKHYITSEELNETILRLQVSLGEHFAQSHKGFMDEVNRNVKETIKTSVNGKIDAMSTKLDPMYEWFTNFTVGRRLTMQTLKTMSFVGGSLVAITGGAAIIRIIIINWLFPK